MEWITVRNAVRLTIAAIIFTYMQPAHAGDDYYYTVGGYAEHIGNPGFVDPYTLVYSDWQEGTDNNILGFEIVDSDSQYGFGMITLDNSYYNRSIMAYRSRYWRLSDNVKAGINLGVVTGYTDWQMKGRYKLDTKLHVMAAPVIVAESDNIFAKLAVLGNAAVITFGAKF